MFTRNFFGKLAVFALPFLFLFIATAHHAFFGDTVQFASRHPDFYYSGHFSRLLLPDSIDSGHPPFFGIYLALVWKIFGRSLFVSHLAMQPFILIIIIQAINLGTNLFPNNRKFSWFLPAILLSECVLIGQCSLVSPDILVIAFFLYALNSILKRNNIHLSLAIIGLGILSMRAMMAAAALYGFAIAAHYKPNEKIRFSTLIKKALPFAPGGLLASSFFIYHFLAKGWIGYHANSPWASSFTKASGIEILRNLCFLAWRFMDLGKIVTVLVFLSLSVAWIRKKRLWEQSPFQIKRIRALFVLFIGLVLFTAIPLCFYNNLLAHRYLIPAYFSISILAIFLLEKLQTAHKNLIFFLMIAGQISGHLWSYPRQVSQGWDSTLAHLPYYGLRKDFLKYFRDNHIPKKEIGAYFFMKNSDNQLDLYGDTTTYRDYQTDSVLYIWYSNVTNSPLDDHFFDYQNKWEILKQEKKGQVEMILFKRK